jgi:hypothetical protein
MMMAWPRPFDSADITYASAPSHQQQGQHPSTASLGVAGTAKAEHRARELHQAMTFAILHYCYI